MPEESWARFDSEKRSEIVSERELVQLVRELGMHSQLLLLSIVEHGLL